MIKKYSDFQGSEFVSFFGLQESERISNEFTRVILEPGGFKEQVYLELKLDDQDNIKLGILELERAWVGNELTINPFAKDICKSFLNELGFPENNIIKDIIEGLWDLHGTNDEIIYIHPPKPFKERKPETQEALKVYLGIKPHFELSFPQLKIRFDNVKSDSKDILRVVIELI